MLLLSHLLLAGRPSLERIPRAGVLSSLLLANISREHFDELVVLAGSNHVLVRGMEVYIDQMRALGDAERASWAAHALETELGRIRQRHSVSA